MRSIYSKLIVLFIVSLLISCQEISAKKIDDRPNIVLILADDMGFSDIGCYGSEIETPTLDKLAANGLRYTQFYNTSRCCPTRASLLTGLYPHQTGLGWMTRLDQGKTGYTGELSTQTVTLAEALKKSGYSTYMAGKWHVNRDDQCQQNSPKYNWPLHRGFDKFYGILKGASDYFKPDNLYDGDTHIQPKEGFYFTDMVNDKASEFINEHFETKKENPFFMYVAHIAPHWPLHAKPEDIAKYQGKYMDGWEATRKKRYEKMLELGVIPPNTKLSKPADAVKNWDSLSADEKKDMDKRMAIFAAQVDALDQGIGRIVATLEKNNQLENTILVFLSDNGSSSLSLSRTTFIPDKESSNTPVSRVDKLYKDLGTQKSYESYGVSWTNVSNTPMKYYKLYEHEGGISTPMIVHWPKGIKTKGALKYQTGHVIDFMPTLLELADASYPSEVNEKPLLPMEGESLVPTFNSDEVHDKAIYFEHVANRGLRDGDWKLVSLATQKFPFTSDWELYNLKEDRSETNNLAIAYPEKVKEMSSKWDVWAKRTNVYPLDGRGWNEKIVSPKGVRTE